MAGERYLTTDHERIREWADARGGRPAAVADTGDDDDPGLIRLDFPGYAGEPDLEPIDWDAWFEKFDDADLVLLFQETLKDGTQSNFHKLVSQSAADEDDDAEWV